MSTWKSKSTTPTARDLMRETKVLIPLGMSVGSAGALLNALNLEVAPVVDSYGRCVGVFTVADYRRWLDRARADSETVAEHSADNGSEPANQVRYHITGEFSAAMPNTGVEELGQRLDATTDPFLIILDRQARPRGIVSAEDVLVAESEFSQVGGELVLAN
jgi:CBS-domain-containing membrane protein